MKNFLSFAVLSLAMIGRLSAAQPETPSQGSAEFERMKTLVGTWKGKTDMGEGSMDFTVEYRLVSGGSVIEERIFAGTPRKWSRCITTKAANWR